MSLPTRFLSMAEIAYKLDQVGYYGWWVVTSTAVIWAESRGNAWAINLNTTNDPASPAYLSLDLGLCQFNSVYFPMPSAEAFDPDASILRMYRVTVGGTRNMNIWAAYTNKAHLPFVGPARYAARSVGVPV